MLFRFWSFLFFTALGSKQWGGMPIGNNENLQDRNSCIGDYSVQKDINLWPPILQNITQPIAVKFEPLDKEDRLIMYTRIWNTFLWKSKPGNSCQGPLELVFEGMQTNTNSPPNMSVEQQSAESAWNALVESSAYLEKRQEGGFQWVLLNVQKPLILVPGQPAEFVH
eukprot:Gregarina_sp_Poly_1__5070@NODE_2688_length_1823_cov_552_005125_g1705_i0_p3_GENE_NODE_2688_length_1823_cov_552_005125_g1705_i0NODE_2688_length_1823_cov_552_005125_g1705_i0_p3_ORF_typecomplete_len167_score21_75_NODE_2688_length_1823_cov_552_005125_g1705_i05481048